MPSYRPPVEDVKFLLNDVFGIGRYANLPGFADLTPDTLDAILSEGARMYEEVWQPLNRTGDKQGCKRHPDGRVTTPDGFREAYRAYAEAALAPLKSATQVVKVVGAQGGVKRLSFEYVDERGVRVSKSVIGKAEIERLILFFYAEGIPVAVELNR